VFVVQNPVCDVNVFCSLSGYIKTLFNIIISTYLLIGWMLEGILCDTKETLYDLYQSPVPAVHNNPRVRSYVTVSVDRVR